MQGYLHLVVRSLQTLIMGIVIWGFPLISLITVRMLYSQWNDCTAYVFKVSKKQEFERFLLDFLKSTQHQELNMYTNIS